MDLGKNLYKSLKVSKQEESFICVLIAAIFISQLDKDEKWAYQETDKESGHTMDTTE
jgi:hypothetical protein